MKHIPLTTLCVAISAVLLTACGGSGSSNPPAPTPIPNAGNAGSGTGGAGSTDNAANAGNTGGTNSGTGSANMPEPKYQDVPTDKNEKDKVSPIQEPAMGYGMALSKMNLHKRQDTPLDEKDIITLDGKKQVAEGKKSPLPFSLDVENKLLDGYIAKMNEADKNAIGDRIKRENEQNKKISDEELAKQIKEAVRKSPYFQQVLSSIQAKTSHSNDQTTKATTRDLQYVDYGYYLVNDADYLTVKTDSPKLWNLGPVGGVFYNGTTTAKELPTQDAVKYKGHWDFMTDVANKRNRFSEVKETPQAGWYYGASSKDEYNRLLTRKDSAPDNYSGEYGHSSEFTVNFKEKKLTGELSSNLQDRHKGDVTKTKRYDIKADIHGNRFRGSATAIDKAKDSETKHPFTSDAKNRLEGGFYGPKGEELAGKFLTDDKKLFGVFGAKQETNADKTEAILDAYALGTFNTEGATTFTPFTKKQLDNFGNAKKLVLGSTVIDLVPTDATKDVNEFTKEKPDSATNKAGETLMVNDEVSVKTYGKNFEYLKFGELSVGDSHSVFLQGERTATTGDKAVPTKGTAKYLGNWVGYITGTGTGKSFNEAQDVADFDIDFEKKTVNGKLTTQGRKDPVFSITGNIAGNGWTGTASTTKANAGGYNIDSNSTNKSIVIKDAEVTGGFYGPNANEMGGSFTHNADDSKASVVFGTKKQEVKQ
ncbi:transferrin-binding protein-like solute binding protein [Moraxella catarrhalis]|uniref:transferrin-binding protein-like solute binding protein n=1 Tax=Moraxella catarrhalis TaxID=480 RepID=UPI000EA8DB9E|nr:transferrin-binding protein-like solute binding protein [Moraxella catarrhalis]MPW49763.1 transferrin-binding protein-like solute binding protein [Moraxella catarrhalis]MPW55068.1 transferrin-binding protein-like solute binding protein [Moraxella catarrhalis]MPW85620.1 transferrin-binding protein-like solute binding protein [Moraxella catarrhalis]MPX40882.1 transferrin-binding protein-like solute binding protein [Moraxella catarrhalis]RKL93615.1 transferrin-binding protein-like solute bindi